MSIAVFELCCTAMAVVSLNSNIASLHAQRLLDQTSARQSVTFERLSSGQRINRASDDAAGLAIASTLSARSRVYTQAIRNVSDGVSALNIAEGSVNQVSNVLIRLRELAIQSSNGTLALAQRRSIDKEGKALTDEFNRTLATTVFNGLSLFDPSLANLVLQLGYGSAGSLATGLGVGVSRKAGTLQFTQISGSAGGPVTDDRDTDTGDINGDGKLDFIDNTGVYLGNGDGTFSTVSTVVTGNLKLTDVNGDNRLDLIVSSGANFTVRIGNGNGTFTAGSSFSNNSANDFELGDINGDGAVDIVGRSATALTVWLNGGAGSYNQTSSVTATAGTGSDLALGDINGDGVLDVVINNATTSRLYSYFGNRNGTLTLAANTTSSLDFDLQLADFNYDGILDVVTSNGVRFGNGNGTFGSNISLSLGSQIEVADMNNDGTLDIVGSISGDGIGVALNNGDGTFKSVQLTGGIDLNGIGTGFLLGDWNGDGVLDAAGFSDLAATNIYLSGTQQTNSIERLSLLTRGNALNALNYIDSAMARVSKEIGNIGASQQRLQASLSNLQQTTLNYDQARSRIVDADIAEESSNLIKDSILKQSAAAVLAQANQSPQIAISLLRAAS